MRFLENSNIRQSTKHNTIPLGMETNTSTSNERILQHPSRLENSISMDGLELGAANGRSSLNLRRRATNRLRLEHQQQMIQQQQRNAHLSGHMSSDMRLKLIEKSVIIHKDENGFGLRVKGQSPVFVDHVHENGAAWRAGVRAMDIISRVNGTSVSGKDHKDVILMFKSCTRLVGLTILNPSGSSQSSGGGRPSVGEINQLPAVVERQRQKQLNFQAELSTTSLYAETLNEQNLPIGTIPMFDCRRQLIGDCNNSHTRLSQWQLTHQQNLQLKGTTPELSYKLVNNNPLENDDHQHQHHHHHFHSSFSGSDQIINTFEPNSTPVTSFRGSQVLAPFATTSSRNLLETQLSLDAQSRRSAASHLSSHAATPMPAYDYQGTGISDSNSGELFCSYCRLPTMNYSKSNQLGHCDQCYRKLIDSNNKLSTASSSQLSLGVFRSLKDPSNPKILIQQQIQKDELARPPKSLLPLSEHSSAKFLSRQQTSHDLLNSRAQQSQRPSSKLAQSASTNSLPSDAAASSFNGTVNQVNPNNSTGGKRTSKRLEIVRELIDTERTHTERLRYLDELFYKPLKTGNLMSREQLRQVFSCHRTLYKIHREIYRILLSANYNLSEEPMVGSALLEIFEGDLKRRLEKASCTFCSAQSTNVELLNKLCRKDTKAGELIAQVTSQQMIGRLGIKDLLASCFQRLTKYPLLLENLLKATPRPPSPQTIELERHSNKAAINRKDSPSESSSGKGASRAASTDDQTSPTNESYEENCVSQTPEELEKARNSRRMLAISLEEEREFIERALAQSRQILVKVNDSIRVAMSHNKLKEIWKRTDKYPGVPLIDITKQQVVHEGPLTLRLSKRSFDVYVLLLNNYIIILTREGQDKYRLKFFTPDGKSSNSTQSVYSPVFVIDEHLTTRDAATDENGFYLLCKRKDDSRIYELASRSPAERMKWRDKIQWTIERQVDANDRRPSCVSTITKSSSEISGKRDIEDAELDLISSQPSRAADSNASASSDMQTRTESANPTDHISVDSGKSTTSTTQSQSPKKEPTKVEGTISFVEDDGIVMPSRMGSSRAHVDQAIQVNILNTIREYVTSS